VVQGVSKHLSERLVERGRTCSLQMAARPLKKGGEGVSHQVRARDSKRFNLPYKRESLGPLLFSANHQSFRSLPLHRQALPRTHSLALNSSCPLNISTKLSITILNSSGNTNGVVSTGSLFLSLATEA
jgi:hypothetical protein